MQCGMGVITLLSSRAAYFPLTIRRMCAVVLPEAALALFFKIAYQTNSLTLEL